MNTRQLVATWYGGFVAATVLLVSAGRSPWPLVTAVAIITALFVYSFSSHVRASGRAVLLSVGGPVLGIALAAGIAARLGSEDRVEAVPPVIASAESTEEGQSQSAVAPAGRRRFTFTFTRIGSIPILPVEQVEVFDIRTRARGFAVDGLQEVVGRVRNRSSQELTRLIVHLRLSHSGSVIDENDLEVFLALLKFMWVRNWLKGLQEAQ